MAYRSNTMNDSNLNPADAPPNKPGAPEVVAKKPAKSAKPVPRYAPGTRPSQFQGRERLIILVVAAFTALSYLALALYIDANRDDVSFSPVAAVVVLAVCAGIAASTLTNRWVTVLAATALALSSPMAAFGAYGLVIWLTLRIGRTSRDLRDAGMLDPPRWVQRFNQRGSKGAKSDKTVGAATLAGPSRKASRSKRYTPPKATASKR